MGILFNLIVIYPLRALFRRWDDSWDEGGREGMKPSNAFLLILCLIVAIAIVLGQA